MISGRLDRRLVFQSKSEVKNAAGEGAITWATQFTRWASIMEIKGKEKFEESQLTERADIRVKIRWETSIDEEYRFYYTRLGVTTFYDIYSIKELGRQDGLEILAKRIKRT